MQDDSARNSLQTFTNGKGDALISYENDAIFAQQQQQPIDFTIPDKTILIENPVAVTANSAHPAEAKAFLDFLQTPDGAEDLRRQRLPPGRARPPRRPPAQFPKPAGLFTIDQLGGWTKVTTEFFDPTKGALVDGRAEEGRSDQEMTRTCRHEPRASADGAPDGFDKNPAGASAAPAAAEPPGGHRAAGRGGFRTRLALGTGVATLYLSLIVLIPLAAVVWRGTRRRLVDASGPPSAPRTPARRSS